MKENTPLHLSGSYWRLVCPFNTLSIPDISLMIFTRSYILLSFNLSTNTCPAGILVEITNYKCNLKHLVMKYINNNWKMSFSYPKYYHVITWSLNCRSTDSACIINRDIKCIKIVTFLSIQHLTIQLLKLPILNNYSTLLSLLGKKYLSLLVNLLSKSEHLEKLHFFKYL